MSNVTHTRTGEAAAGDSPTERMGSLPPPPPPTDSAPGRERPPGRDPGAGRRKALIAALVVLVVLAVTAVFVVLAGDDQGDDEVSPATTTTGVTSTTAAPSSTTSVTTAPTAATSGPATTVTVPPVDATTAVFPAATAGVRYDDPVDAARAFAVDFVGFTDPLVGDFMQGDARSGEVQVRAMAQGPVTTVFVRQLGTDGSWWVLGSAADTITVDTPATGDRITAPVTVSGRALAFEGTVEVEVRADGTSRPIGIGTVTGGGDEMRPFEGQVAFTSPGQGYGALMFLTHSAEDGRVWQAATLRVRF